MRKIIFITFAFILISLSACNITEPNRMENATVTNNASVSLTFQGFSMKKEF